MSQKSWAAAMTAGLPLADPPFWTLLKDVDLAACRRAADLAVESDPDPNRAARRHDAHEAAYVQAAVRTTVAALRPTEVAVAAAPGEPELDAVRAAAGDTPVTLIKVECEKPAQAPPTPPPPDLGCGPEDAAGARLVFGPGLIEPEVWLRAAVADGGRAVFVPDAHHSGDLPALFALCRSLGRVGIAPLFAPGAPRFTDLGSNDAYAAHVQTVLKPLFAAGPRGCVASDLWRPDTAVLARLARSHGVPLTLRAHGWGAADAAYRFPPAEAAGARRLAWTASGGGAVLPPRRLRGPAYRLWARGLARAPSLFRPARRLGLVVTSDELFAAPRVPLARLLEGARALTEGARARGGVVAIRLRRFEDSPALWREAVPEATVETQDDRPFAAFARACDLLVELGAPSSAGLEAALLGVPYLRLGPADADAPLPAPELETRDPWSRLEPFWTRPGDRLRLTLDRWRAAERLTRPTAGPLWTA